MASHRSISSSDYRPSRDGASLRGPTATSAEFRQLAERVEREVHQACGRFGVEPPHIRWSSRMTSSAGKASKKEVVFSIPLFRCASEAFCMETAAHEAAHYIDFQRRGTSDHGPGWRRIMASLGYPNARRCHAIDRTVLYRYEVRCARCDEPLVKYTRRPTRTLKRKRSACCYARLRLVSLE